MAEQKTKIAVLMGGPSAEHKVSLGTGRMVFKFLNRRRYEPRPILITKNGRWPVSFKTLKRNFDLVFNAMHGEYGEDGTVQELLDKLTIPYTGSGALASELGMDKIRSLPIFEEAKLKVPPYIILKNSNLPAKRFRALGLPLVIKPADRGSSVGVAIVRQEGDFPAALKQAFRYSHKVLAQKYISGREVTCGVLEKNGRLIALPPTEIVPLKRKFFDYYSKYAPKATAEITPARLPGKLLKEIQAAALKAHRVIGAAGYSRTDMILENSKSQITNHKLYILEINTLPGLTQGSLLPRAAKAAGINFPKLLDYIIEAALKRF